MGCGSSNTGGTAKKSVKVEDNNGIEIIKEHYEDRPHQEACKPHEIKRPPPSHTHHLTHPSIVGENPYEALLRHYDPKKAHILVVDDDTRERELLCGWFREAEYQVTSVSSGEECPSLLHRMLAELPEGATRVKDLDLVLMDLHMSSESSSILDELCNHAAFGHVPVIVSGGAVGEVSPQQAERMVRRGAADFMYKPMSRALVLKTVRTLLQNSIETENTATLKKLGDDYKNTYTKITHQLNRKHAFSISSKSGSLEPLGGRPSRDDDMLAAIPRSHMLVVEPDEDTSELLKKWIGKKYEVTVCRDAQVAVKRVKELQDASGDAVVAISSEAGQPGTPRVNNKVDLVLTEARLEGEFQGVDVVDSLSHHASTSRIPVMLMSSADAPPEEMTHAIRAGCENYISKPLSRDVTIQKIEVVLLAIAQHNLAKQYMHRAVKYDHLVEQAKRDHPNELKAIIAKDQKKMTERQQRQSNPNNPNNPTSGASSANTSRVGSHAADLAPNSVSQQPPPRANSISNQH